MSKRLRQKGVDAVLLRSAGKEHRACVWRCIRRQTGNCRQYAQAEKPDQIQALCAVTFIKTTHFIRVQRMDNELIIITLKKPPMGLLQQLTASPAQFFYRLPEKSIFGAIDFRRQPMQLIEYWQYCGIHLAPQAFLCSF
ncbi:TPA: hypothetical protein I8Y90_000725 [Legionella pneumophila]|nr:hypothetical protein [Legionella pneumophila]